MASSWSSSSMIELIFCVFLLLSSLVSAAMAAVAEKEDMARVYGLPTVRNGGAWTLGEEVSLVVCLAGWWAQAQSQSLSLLQPIQLRLERRWWRFADRTIPDVRVSTFSPWTREQWPGFRSESSRPATMAGTTTTGTPDHSMDPMVAAVNGMASASATTATHGTTTTPLLHDQQPTRKRSLWSRFLAWFRTSRHAAEDAGRLEDVPESDVLQHNNCLRLQFHLPETVDENGDDNGLLATNHYRLQLTVGKRSFTTDKVTIRRTPPYPPNAWYALRLPRPNQIPPAVRIPDTASNIPNPFLPAVNNGKQRLRSDLGFFRSPYIEPREEFDARQQRKEASRRTTSSRRRTLASTATQAKDDEDEDGGSNWTAAERTVDYPPTTTYVDDSPFAKYPPGRCSSTAGQQQQQQQW